MSEPRKLVTSQTEEDPSKNGDYVIEKILQRRIRNNVTEYYVKWKGWGDVDNTWQLAEDIRPKSIVDDFESSQRRKLKFIAELKKLREQDASFRAVQKRKSGYKEGFQRGFSPEKILGVVNKFGQKRFLVKWKGLEDADLVTSEEANVNCPNLVIAFYEKQLIWDATVENTQNTQ